MTEIKKTYEQFCTFYEKNVNDHKDVLALIEHKVKVLGVVRKAAAVNKTIIDGKPVVATAKTTDVAQEYMNISKNI